MTTPRETRALLALAAAFALGACADGTSPEVQELAGAWSLSAVAGEAIPVALEPTQGPDFVCETRIVSGSLVLDADGRYRLSVDFRRACTNDVSEAWTRLDSGTFRVEPGRAFFEQDGDSDWYQAITEVVIDDRGDRLGAFTSFGSPALFLR